MGFPLNAEPCAEVLRMPASLLFGARDIRYSDPHMSEVFCQYVSRKYVFCKYPRRAICRGVRCVNCHENLLGGVRCARPCLTLIEPGMNRIGSTSEMYIRFRAALEPLCTFRVSHALFCTMNRYRFVPDESAPFSRRIDIWDHHSECYDDLWPPDIRG